MSVVVVVWSLHLSSIKILIEYYTKMMTKNISFWCKRKIWFHFAIWNQFHTNASNWCNLFFAKMKFFITMHMCHEKRFKLFSAFETMNYFYKTVYKTIQKSKRMISWIDRIDSDRVCFDQKESVFHNYLFALRKELYDFIFQFGQNKGENLQFVQSLKVPNDGSLFINVFWVNADGVDARLIDKKLILGNKLWTIIS